MEHVKKHQSHTAGRLHRVLSTQTGNDNMVMSPLSVGTILAMTHAGASGNTATQIQEALALPPDTQAVHAGYADLLQSLKTPAGGITLELANVMYAQQDYKLSDKFVATLKDKFGSDVKSVNFADTAGVSKLINDHVSDLTRDKITDLIKESALNAMVRLVLVNAVYFKGSWKNKFDVAKTEKRDFHVAGGTPVQTEMMLLSGTRFLVASVMSLGCRLLEMPFEGERFAMLVLLPDQQDGLETLEAQLEITPLAELRSKHLRQKKANIVLPKFKLEVSFDLIEPLKKMGIIDLFDATTADLSGVTQKKGELFVSKVVHKAFIEVNEEGSEAAAATGMVMMMRCAPMDMDEFNFVADHPFMFTIIDISTGVSLFSGKYVKPQHN